MSPPLSCPTPPMAEGGLLLPHCGFTVPSLPSPLLLTQGQVLTILSSPSLPSSSSVFWSLSLSQTLSTLFRCQPDPLQHTLSLPILFITFPPLYGCSSGQPPLISSLPLSAQHRDAAIDGGPVGKDSRVDKLQPRMQGTSRRAGTSAAPFTSLLQTGSCFMSRKTT